MALRIFGVIHFHLSIVPESFPQDTICRCFSIRSRCSLKEIVRRGDAAEQIIEAVPSVSCDIIVLGGQHKHFHDTTVLGTTAIRVTRHAPCPVLTVIRK